MAGFSLIAGFAAWGAVDEPSRPRPAVDDEDRQVRIFESRRLIEQNCLICHSDEMISHQRLTPKQWAAEVEKMIGWGSPLPRAEASGLAAFLAEQYATSTPPPVPEKKPVEVDRKPVLVAPIGGDFVAGSALFAVHCAGCHGPSAIGSELGPNLVEKPVLISEAEFAEVIQKGRRRMPGLESILSRDQITNILAWLQTRR